MIVGNWEEFVEDPLFTALRVLSKPWRLTERLQQQPDAENADVHPASTSAESVRIEAS
jgi:hypothetical protein